MINEIRELRGKLGLTQEKLAQQLDVSVQTIRRWESDRGKKPSSIARRLIKELFQVEIKWK